LLKQSGVGVSLGAKVKLHGPIPFGVPLSDVKHEKSAEGIGFSCGGSGALSGLLEDLIPFPDGAGVGQGIAHAVVGHAASFFVEKIVTIF